MRRAALPDGRPEFKKFADLRWAMGVEIPVDSTHPIH